jgi:hypothetical protein
LEGVPGSLPEQHCAVLEQGLPFHLAEFRRYTAPAPGQQPNHQLLPGLQLQSFAPALDRGHQLIPETLFQREDLPQLLQHHLHK